MNACGMLPYNIDVRAASTESKQSLVQPRLHTRSIERDVHAQAVSKLATSSHDVVFSRV